jgi:spore coat protein SA
MSKIRVAIVTPGTFAIPSAKSSSVELAVMQTAKQMAGEAELTVFGKKTLRQPSRETRGGIRFIRPPRRNYIRNVSRILKKLKPDMIQVENRPRFARFLKKRFPDTHVALSLHSTTFISKPNITPQALAACLQHADSIIVNSHFLKSYIANAVPEAEPKIAVNHLGADPERFIPKWEADESKRLAKLRKLGLEGKKIILYVGRLIPIKGVHHLLRAMPAIAAIEPDAVLLIVGSAFYGSKRKTAYVKRLRRMAAPIKKHVRFIPYVGHASIPSWFQLADVVVVPSPEREAFGLVNVEAMATGLPVVAAGAGGMTEIIEHGQSGLLANPERLEEEIVAYVTNVLNDSEFARTLGEQAVRRVRDHFTWKKTAERLLEHYRNMEKAGVREADRPDEQQAT